MLALSALVHLRSNTGLPLYDICFMTDEGEVVIWDHETAEVKSFKVEQHARISNDIRTKVE